MDIENIPAVAAYPAWHSFVKEKSGIIMGGELNRQTVFNYQSIPFNDQGLRLPPGLGHAVNPEDHRRLDLVVIPQNRGVS